jgi:hypothetical protein
MDFTGTWDVVSSLDFDYGYLRKEAPPYVTLKGRSRVEARYVIGVRAGHLDGWLHSNFFIFGFEGMDEVHGDGGGTLNGDYLTFELRHFQGTSTSSTANDGGRATCPRSAAHKQERRPDTP